MATKAITWLIPNSTTKKKNLFLLLMPPYSYQILQQFDVRRFSVLKIAYGTQISELTKVFKTHTGKEDFLLAFNATF